MVDLTKLSHRSKAFARKFGVSLPVFQMIVELVRPKWEESLAQKKCAGRKSKILNLENEVLMVLLYYRHHMSFFELGAKFGLSESNACRHVHKMEKLLAQVIHIDKLPVMDMQGSDATYIVDATEIQIQRPKRKQAKDYSGKAKRHTKKVETIVDVFTGKIVNVSQVFDGSTHDFTIRKMSLHLPPNALLLADSGYQGLQNIHEYTLLPDKATKNNPLSKAQKKYNRALASVRVQVEHVFAWLKKFAIFGTKYRGRRRRLNLRLNIMAGIYNMKLALK